jgi:hypothetical protein
MTDACVDEKPIDFDWRRFDKACRYVSKTNERGTQTALITGRGEPTLYPSHLTKILRRLDLCFPCIEIQTNGVLYKELPWEEYKMYGLNTIAISVCSFDSKQNNDIMNIKKEFDVRDCIQYLSSLGFTIRVGYQLTAATTPPRGQWKDWLWFENTIQDAKKLGVQQLTFRQIGKPDKTSNQEVFDWVENNRDKNNYNGLLNEMGVKLSTYHWGGMIYDIKGMSVCIADCLTENPDTFEPRSWIFDGKNLRFSWQHEGAIVF